MSQLTTQATTEIKESQHGQNLKMVYSLLIIVLLFAITAVPSPVQAYDAAWNGGREDITGHDEAPDPEGCQGDECPDDPCDATRSPVYVADGSLIWSDTDIRFPSATRVGLKRTYNSFDYRAGLFGRGWVTAQEIGIAKTYKATSGGFASVPIWMTKTGVRYTLTDNGTSCTAPDVLFFSFEKRADGSYKQIFEDNNSFNIFSDTGSIQESYSDRDGTTIYYEYDEQQRLIKQFDSNDYTLNFAYNDQGFVTEVTDQADRRWSYIYNDNGLLEKVLDPDGNSKDYSYQTIDKIGYKKHLLTDVKDNLAVPVLKVSWTESTLNGRKAMRVTRYTEIDGRAHDYSYANTTYKSEPAIRTTKTTRQIGSSSAIETQTFIADASSYRVLDESSQKIGLGITTQKSSFNERGKLTERLDKRGNTTLYEYNEAGYVTKTTQLANTDDARIITQTYLEGTNRIKVINEYGLREIRYSYDSDLRITQQTQIDLATNEARTLKYSYHSNTTDSQGNTVLGKLKTIDGSQTGTEDTWAFSYNAQNRLTKVDQPLNQSVSYTYNNAGQLLTDSDVNGIVTKRSYDSKNRLIKTTRSGRSQNFTYTAQGQIESITDELARKTSFAYNPQQQPTKITYPSEDYLLLSYDYGSSNTEVTREYYLKNNTLVSTQISQLNPVDGFTEQEYLASTAQTVNQYQRNAQNDITQVKHFGTYNNTTQSIDSYSYDSLGQLTQINDGLNGNTDFAYDSFNRLVQVTDANQGVTQYAYTAQGDLIQKVSPDTGTTDYQYDSVGNVIQENNANNVSVDYSYDALNRVTEIDYQGDELDTILSYDQGTNGKGRLTTANDGSGSSQYQYDDRGLITSTTATIAGTELNTGYHYNQSGQLTQIDYPSGTSASYQYDSAGRLNRIQTADQGNTTDIISNINWNGPNMGSYQQGNGLVTELTYDTAGRLTEKQFGSDNGIQNLLDNQSQILQQTWTRNNTTEINSFQYDVLGRLTQDGSNADNQFGYDAVGNRLSETQPSKSYGYQSNSNRLSDINGTTIQRDAVGNTLDDGTRQYQYNAMNRLSGLTNSQNNVQASYTYNYLGQRVRKQLSGGQSDDIRFVYGLQGELLGEYQANGQVIREYLYQTENGIAELVAERTADGTLIYIHADHLGTPRLATDQAQTVVWRWDSDAFGTTQVNNNPDGDSNPTTINHRFAGQYFDEESGVHYNYHRYYDPSTGRYITSDPIGLAGGLNTYAYVSGNPLRFIDPSGTTEVLLSSCALGGFANPFCDAAIIINGCKWVAIVGSIVMMSGDSCSGDDCPTDDSPNEDDLSEKINEIARKTGLSPKEVRDRIHNAKTNLPKGTGVRNPDVKVDTTTGEVYPQTPDGGIGDSIGNLFD
jgi:RHS repeat-associated protein